MENSYEIFNLRKNELCELAQKQLEISSVLDGDVPESSETLTGTQKVSGIIERLKNEKFSVLVMGCFSSGKSTFLNALLGEKILPSSSLPCTGVLTFIGYANDSNKKIILYPKPGMGKNGSDEPFEVADGDLKRILSDSVRIPKGSNKEEATETSRYKKLQLLYPLSLCKDGVEIIDSVGLNDPAARDAITLGFAQKADSIVYCMPSIAANNMKDKSTVSLLDGIGFKDSIFFILTYFDKLQENAESDGEDIEALVKSISAELSSKTGLKSEGVKFVDSKGALNGEPNAKKRLDDVAKSLETFLVSQKGSKRLQMNFQSLKSVNDDACLRIPAKIKMLKSDTKSIEEQIKKTELPLKNREKECTGILEQIESDGKDIEAKVSRKIKNALDTLSRELPCFIDGVEFDSSDMKNRGTELSEAVREFVEQQMIKIQSELQEEIDPDLERLKRNIKSRYDDFSEHITELKNDVGLSSSYIDSLAGKGKVGSLEMFGIGATGGALAGIFSLGFAPAIPVIAVAWFALKHFRTKRETEKLKETMKAECEKFLTENKQLQSQVVAEYSSQIEKIKTMVGKELRSQIDSIRKDISSALTSHSQNKASREAEIDHLEKLAKSAQEIKQALSAFGTKIQSAK